MSSNDVPEGVAAIYARISEDREGAGLGVGRQVEDCMPLCTAHGYPPERIRVYDDNDTSAYSGRPRPKFRKLLEDIQAGDVTFLAAWHPDRLYRHPRDLEEFIDTIESAGCDVATARAGELDLTTPSGRLVARLLGATARYESDHKADRIKRQKQQQRENGLPHGGPRPFGWAKKVVTGQDGRQRTTWNPIAHDAEEAQLIREAIDDLLRGASLADIARRWRDLDVPQPQSGKAEWTVDTVRQVVSNPRNAGLVGHRIEMPGREKRGYARYARPTEFGPAKWPAIVDPDRWRDLQAVLDQRGSLHRQPRRRSLLTGLLVCAECGCTMVRSGATGRRGDGTRLKVYRCPGRGSGVYAQSCGRVSILAGHFEGNQAAAGLEGLVVTAVLRAIDQPAFALTLAHEGPDSDNPDPADELRALDARMSEAAARVADGDLSIDQYRHLADAIETKQRAQREALAKRASETTLRPYVADPGVLRKSWLSMTLDQRRAILAATIERITISPAIRRGRPTFDPGRVAITWKGAMA